MTTRKPLGLGLVIGLLAAVFAALPAIASAAPALTGGPGTLVPTGTTITFTSTYWTVDFTRLGSLTCEHVEFPGIVRKNNGTEVEVGMDGEDFAATGCKISGAAVTVKTTFEELRLTPTSKTMKFTFTVDPYGLTETSTSTVTYTGSDATKIHVAGTVGGTNPGAFMAELIAYYRNSKGTNVPILFD